MSYLRQKVQERLRACGCESRIVSVAHLRDLESEIEGRHVAGEFTGEFYRVELADFEFHPPTALPNARSIIVMAAPQPLVHVSFCTDGRISHSFIPPTYDTSLNDYAQEILTRTLEPDGYCIAPCCLPLKLLATRSGLATYGKNNISYVQAMGSFHRLMAFYSDLPPGDDVWSEPRMLYRCSKCSACINNCPTKAFDPERFLLHAERCLTFLNEFPGDFPAWIDPSCHQCPVGCMMCQSVCPENRHVAKWIEKGPVFSEEETALLLRGVGRDQLPEELSQKLRSVGLLEYLAVLPRNLRVILGRPESGIAELRVNSTHIASS